MGKGSGRKENVSSQVSCLPSLPWIDLPLLPSSTVSYFYLCTMGTEIACYVIGCAYFIILPQYNSLQIQEDTTSSSLLSALLKLLPPSVLLTLQGAYKSPGDLIKMQIMIQGSCISNKPQKLQGVSYFTRSFSL